MSDTAIHAPHHAAHHRAAHSGRPNLDGGTHYAAIVIFFALLVIGLGFTLHGLTTDIDAAGTPPLAIGVFIMLGLALLIALGFEFVNGFHDTANAVATAAAPAVSAATPAVKSAVAEAPGAASSLELKIQKMASDLAAGVKQALGGSKSSFVPPCPCGM